MDTSKTKSPLHGLAQTLVLEKILDEETARTAFNKAQEQAITFVKYLVNNNILSAHVIAETAAKNFGVPFFNLDVIDKDVIPANVVSEKLILRHNALPIMRRGNYLFIAVSDPSQQITLDEIKFHTGLNVHCVLTEVDKLNKLIETILSEQEAHSLNEFNSSDFDNLEQLDISAGNAQEQEEESSGDDAPIVRFVNKILLDAVNRGASDIHFEPYEKNYRIRLRMDGILHEIAAPPVTLANRITSRIKVMAQLDISERRIPQDGRFKLRLSAKRAIDFRISTCPTVAGEKVVLRILDPSNATIGIEGLGFDRPQQELFLKVIHQPQGMVLVTGPTGSGKTVTLYTALNILNTCERNISTAEDPVEIHVQGINQVDINYKTGLTFATALRSFLRQDPDIIMVGEMRDLETAEIGVKAAQTGHLVLSTLHTNSAPETLTRLVNMGVAPFNIATSVSLIVAQRLARRLCTQCKIEHVIPHEALLAVGFKQNELSTLKIYAPQGCDHCTNGYKGRVGLYEILYMTPTLGQLVMEGGNALQLAQQAAQEGMITLRQSGLQKVRNGLTSLEEINRVTKD
ncbi:MAG: type IV-A pilus assembly ATPase PilB [Gammaproteobacteria bacterium]